MRLSTHVLDTEIGEPAGGVKVGLYRGEELISLQETDQDGRIATCSRPTSSRASTASSSTWAADSSSASS